MGSLNNTLRILIVEDEAIIAMLLKETVEGWGHVVCAIAKTEADAVDAAIRDQPDLIIADAGLKVGSGILAMETISKTHSIPHVFVTGNVRKVRALRPDAVVLEKPFFTHDLVDAIDRALAVSAERSAE